MVCYHFFSMFCANTAAVQLFQDLPPRSLVAKNSFKALTLQKITLAGHAEVLYRTAFKNLPQGQKPRQDLVQN